MIFWCVPGESGVSELSCHVLRQRAEIALMSAVLLPLRTRLQ
ncbi:hypothetical protein ECBCE032MS12_1612 [Escherichia coli BCE032_MS-12]|nr:hypothetical protein ECBCE032MS12_5049 [Escherichia coli BCE032_MS-12]ENB28702.1 hypothetical protein ECBCE032MS12_4912 [Escherichia coli BCE032_MS-12]ENB30988.1 hypothetical protein ECBCE032MS12_3889 [Escherichia coli BCE032_MS-12]ENB33031.1 hypothetical protein ECBCE032MS12_3142 [Escherichia coli BCE032_MS-12]ENB36018.1 hypothetical protein ECBCE032MS12_1957 [Escherichia coli BCE032_MS-12]